MKDLFCLSEQAIRVLKEPGMKWKLMYALEINDSRTIDKHIKNNFPSSPLMNFNVKEIIKEVSPHLNDGDIYSKLTNEDMARLRAKQKKDQNT
jgi:hypothetical protein